LSGSGGRGGLSKDSRSTIVLEPAALRSSRPGVHLKGTAVRSMTTTESEEWEEWEPWVPEGATWMDGVEPKRVPEVKFTERHG
jgi:hypothetical protein